jgi:hypothetical protein
VFERAIFFAHRAAQMRAIVGRSAIEIKRCTVRLLLSSYGARFCEGTYIFMCKAGMARTHRIGFAS